LLRKPDELSPDKQPAQLDADCLRRFCFFHFFAIVTGRGLYADGSLYFLMVLKAGGFAPIIPCRDFATYAQLWLKPSTFPDLKRYGVDYAEYVDALNREKLNHDR
jgi:hypothetical protein